MDCADQSYRQGSFNMIRSVDTLKHEAYSKDSETVVVVRAENFLVINCIQISTSATVAPSTTSALTHIATSGTNNAGASIRIAVNAANPANPANPGNASTQKVLPVPQCMRH